MNDKFPWTEQDLYVPPPLDQRSRVTAGVFIWLCLLAVACGALWALSN